MSTLIVQEKVIDEIKPHNNADTLEIAIVGGWQTIVRKGSFIVGQLVVFIPPDAILPETLHTFLSVSQYLGELPIGYYNPGEKPTAKRVKAARLRGEPSYGLVMSLRQMGDYLESIGKEIVNITYVNKEGTDVKDLLGIDKWEPPIKCTQGDIERDNSFFTKYTDIENWRNFVDVFCPEDDIVVLEKAHGSFLGVGYCQDVDENGNMTYQLMVRSHNTRRKMYDKNGALSIYWKSVEKYPQLESLVRDLSNNERNVQVCGELLGTQDMMYTCKSGEHDVRIFDIKVDEEYLDWDTVIDLCQNYKLPTVPELYRGKYNPDIIKELTDGPTLVCDKPNSKFKGREGVVFKTVPEKTHPKLGRMILKSVSVDYLSRRGATDGH